LRRLSRTALVVLLALAATGGCVLDRVSRREAVWLAADRIFFLRTVDSAPSELWERSPGGRERRVATWSDLPSACGAFDFLFRMPDARLGVVLECDDETSQLFAYLPAESSFELIGDLPYVADIAFRSDISGGFVGTGNNRCWAISPFELPARAESVAVFPELTCAAGASAKSPMLTRAGRLVFLATHDPLSDANDDTRRWSLYTTETGGRGYRATGPTVRGFPVADISVDGTAVAIAVNRGDETRLLMVNLRTGESENIRESEYIGRPTFSPDGTRLAFVEDFDDIRILDLSVP